MKHNKPDKPSSDSGIRAFGGISEALRYADSKLEVSSDPKVSPIEPCDINRPIPKDARCQEASSFSRETYIACGSLAVAIVYHDKDQRGYYMCLPCADHNINRGGKLVKVNLAGRALVGRAQKAKRDYRHMQIEPPKPETYGDVLKRAASGKACVRCGRQFTSVSQYRYALRGTVCRKPCRGK